MDKYRSARLVSDELVVTEAENNQETVNKIPAFAEGIVKLKVNNTQIRAAMLKQKQSIGGVTTQKGNSQDVLVDLTIDVLGGIHSYAESKNDYVLKAKVEYSNSQIEHMGHSELITTSSGVLELAKGIDSSELAHFGISADEVNEFEQAFIAFNAVKSGPKQAIIEHSKHTDSIAKLQADSQTILNMLDKLATQFRRKDPVYYDVYVNSRKNSGGSSRRKKDDGSDATPPTSPTK